MENKISNNDMEMNKSDLEKLTKSQLIELLKQNNKKPNRKPVPTPRKSVKQMVQDFEENIILPPPEFRDDYKPFLLLVIRSNKWFRIMEITSFNHHWNSEMITNQFLLQEQRK